MILFLLVEGLKYRENDQNVTVKWSESVLQGKWHQQTCLAQGDHRPSTEKISVSAKCIKVMGDKMRYACLSILEDVGILGPE